jgi:hypothetical protein
VGGVLRRGGPLLARSMVDLRLRSNDRPQNWPAQIGRWLRRTP